MDEWTETLTWKGNYPDPWEAWTNLSNFCSCESCQITSYFKQLDNRIQNITEMKIII